ncbi:MAG TPA: septal ring lytic transglycosylase RlpA family protein [Edaphobacter sp.]|jgi:rare lipoprotein A|nr:septal ring lytic transglycosylase RlpA family protein [Edaphobacter sp.]
MGRTRTAVLLAALVILSAFATETATPVSARATDSTMVANDVPSSEIVTTVPAPKTTVLTRIKSGMASWYGSVLQGHPTASGRRFNMYELTAAHRTLPFGSRVKVTNLRNHRSVVVTITDRGVLFPERVIDLSWAAAKELNMLKMGVDPVRLELITERG